MRPAPDFSPTAQASAVRILLVEDDARFAALIRAELEAIGWARIALEHADTLGGALALLRHAEPDLVITDLNLPDSRHLDTLQRIARATDRPVIVLTGEKDEGLRETAVAKGAYDLLDKDRLERPELERLIRLAILQASALRRYRESAEKSRALSELLAGVNAANEVLLRAKSADELLQSACDIGAKANGFSLASIYLVRDDGQTLERAAASGPAAWMDETPPSTNPRSPYGKGLVGQAFRSGVVVVSNDYERDPVTASSRRRRSYVVGSAAAFPLKVDGAVVGVFGLLHARPGAFSEELTALIQRLADNIGFALASFRRDAALRESEERYRALVELSSDWYWEQDEHYRFVRMSERVLPHVREARIGRTCWEIETDEPVHGTWEEHRRKVERHEAYRDLLLRCKRPDGSVGYVSVSGQPVFRDGVFVGYQGSTKDVTDRVRAEEELRSSEERFRQLTELSSDWYWEQDESFRLVRISSGNDPIVAEVAAGKRPWEIPGYEPVGMTWDGYRALVSRHESLRDALFRLTLPDGGERYLSVSAQPVLEHSAFRGYRGTAKDVTADKREERLLALEHAVARDLADAVSVAEALPAVMGAICRSEDWQCARYFDPDEAEEEMILRHAWTDGSEAMLRFVERARNIRYTFGTGLVGRVWRSGEPLWVNDTSSDSRVGQPDLARQTGVHAALIVPIAFEGRVIGVVSLSSTRVRSPDERLLQAVRLIGAQIGQFVQRKNAEAALAESEARFRQTFELAASGIAHVSPEGRLLQVNRRLCEALGYEEAELKALTVRELTHPDDLAVSDAGLVEMREGRRESYRFEKRYRHKDGRYVWFSINVAVVRGPYGKPLYEVAVFDDITERRLKDEALRESEERFRNLSELSSDWYWEQDESLRFTRLYGSAHARLSQDMIGKARWEAPGVDPDAPDMREHRQRLERRERFRDFEYSYLGQHGRRVHVRVSGYPVVDADGRFRGYRGTARNVTRQRESREQLRRFRTALDASADIILLVDPRDLRLLDFNETACYYLRYARDELVGKQADELLEGTSVDALRASLEQLLRRDDRTDLVLRTYRRKDGTTFEAEVLRRAVESDEGAIVVVNARDLTERRRAEERQAAHLRYQECTARFGQAALAKRDAAGLVAEAVQVVREALGSGVAAYLERGAGELEAIVQGIAGASEAAAGGGAGELAPEEAVCQVLRTAEPVLVDGKPRAMPRFPWAADAECGAFVPVHGEHDVRGVLCALLPQRSALGPEESRFLVAAASVLSAGLSRIESEGRLAFLAQFDVLTGLPNRALLRDRFSQLIVQARRHGYNLGVLFIDLDDFKMVNDSLGHAGGDELLKVAASRLLAAVRPGDTVARISGDEFAVILGDLARPDDGAIVAQKIIDSLAAPLEVAGQEVFVTASIGIAAFPADGEDAETLLAAADAAMYRAKQSGRNGYQFYTADINQRTRARAQLGSELRRALERGEFEVHYQPKFDLRTGRACAAEALVRWRHPERGVVMPGEFVPVLEETGLIVPVGETVLRRACEDIKRWAAAGLPETPVAVNLSARQFRQQSLDEHILELVREAGVDPRLIELEITESQLMQDPEHAARVLRALSEAGISVAIDDFGTGYSSLSYLTRFPVSALKIDRSFVADVLEDHADAAIVRAIIDMAHTLGFIVVAEGVETDSQAVLLRSLGCEQAQGYFFARPMPAAQFRALLAAGTPK